VEKFIEISHYSLIHYKDSGLGELIFFSRSNGHRNDTLNSECAGSGTDLILEVHHDGLHVTPSENKECIESLNKRKK
jgi:hypothetical protein